ncbi:hypothetical protein [Nonlabens xiamenensis]|uniref:hypothetical protein n=1 Tax=Nonlabens xiamenensis TaxID=2341043 RepID=UPI000F60C8CC|nr:hypothetical protein [Nonlabens xiamenensis]
MRLFTLSLCFLFLAACSVEETDTAVQELDVQIEAGAFLAKSTSPTATLCQSTDLIAGQNIVVGTVDVYIDGFTLSVVYNTIPGWNIDETHMSIGNCTDDIPTTGSGNPKIGHFEYSAIHSAGTQVVTYTVDSSTLPVETCVATHAVVSSTSGQNETAWGAGVPFPGRSWATYMELDTLACTSGGKEPSDPNEDR